MRIKTPLPIHNHICSTLPYCSHHTANSTDFKMPRRSARNKTSNKRQVQGVSFLQRKFFPKFGKGRFIERIYDGASWCLAGIVHHFAVEVLVSAGISCRMDNRTKIGPQDILFAAQCIRDLLIPQHNIEDHPSELQSTDSDSDSSERSKHQTLKSTTSPVSVWSTKTQVLLRTTKSSR